MYPKQQLIAIITFIALFLGSLIMLFIQYDKNKQLQSSKEDTVQVWLAKHDVKEGDKINGNDVYPMEFPKANIYFRRLEKNEIIGKYAKTPLLANEPIRYEKIIKVYKRKTVENLTKKAKDEPIQIKSNIPSEIQPKFDVYTAKVEMFKNINFFIKANDTIDLIAVWPDNEKDDINVRYIATDVTVLGFTANGEFQYDYKKETIVADHRQVTLADEIILDLRPKEIANLLKLYYRGQHLGNNSRGNTRRAGGINTGNQNSHVPEGQLWIVSVGSSLNDRSLSREKRLLKYSTIAPKATNNNKKAKSKKVTVEYE